MWIVRVNLKSGFVFSSKGTFYFLNIISSVCFQSIFIPLDFMHICSPNAKEKSVVLQLQNNEVFRFVFIFNSKLLFSC